MAWLIWFTFTSIKEYIGHLNDPGLLSITRWVVTLQEIFLKYSGLLQFKFIK